MIPRTPSSGPRAQASKDVASLLEIHREALDALAQELVLKKRLTGDDVAKLIAIE